MKKCMFFFFTLLSLSLYSMEQPLPDSFADEMFANGDKRYLMLLGNKNGREILMIMRAAERRALNSGSLEHQMGLQRFKPSLAFGRKNSIARGKKEYLKTGAIIRSANVLKDETTDMAELMEGILDTEYFLMQEAENTGMLYCTWYELSRRDDIILFKKCVENDTFRGSRILLFEVLKKFEKSHKEWPPKSNTELFEVSAYAVIKKALEHRQQHKIDEQDTNESQWLPWHIGIMQNSER